MIAQPDVHTNGNGKAIVSPPESEGVRFLQVLFAPGDHVLIRPIETWLDNGKKVSRTDYKGTEYWLIGLNNGNAWVPDPTDHRLSGKLQRQLAWAQTERTNLFFGVCPRLGTDGAFDQAWQIRTVRVLWSDIDDCTHEEALKRIEEAGLPRPSILVNSGHGCHTYWLLSEPVLIDDADAGAPPRVHTEWIDQGEGKKKKRRPYILNGLTERLYLDIKDNVPLLSPKAQHVQDVIAGIASKIGGDHTHDLSRILRIPGTLNRKDERNGQAPIRCSLVEFDPTRRDQFADFEPFVVESPARKRREHVAKVSLPTPRKLTPGKNDKLAELALTCSVASVGDRSEADFALCAWAIERGVSQTEVWAQVQNVGKFADGGKRYFQRTWDKAAQHTRERIFDQAEAKAVKRNRQEASGGAAADSDDDPGMVKMLADLICAGEHFAEDAGGRLYRHADGVYRPRGENFVRTQVKRLCIGLDKSKVWSTRLATEVVEFIRVDAPQLWERPPIDVLNIQNGLLRVTEHKLLPHDPAQLSPVQLPIKYDPAARCPKIDAFVGQVFPSDAHSLAWEIPAWLMLPDTSIQKAVLLTGEGANGKSTWLSLVATFLDKRNTSGVSLHKLEADKFAAARLIGKLANICPDLPSEHLVGTSVFKAITGGDPLPAEYKFKDSFEFTPFCRLVFSANYPPRSTDSSHAFFRRWLVIPFDRTFSSTEQIPRDILDGMLTSPEELSGMLNKALDALDRLRERRAFSESKSVLRAWEDFRATTDPLAVWIDAHTIAGPDAVVVRDAVRGAYNQYAREAGVPPLGKEVFGRALRKLRPEILDGQRTSGGKRQWCYIGIGFRTQDPATARVAQDAQG